MGLNQRICQDRKLIVGGIEFAEGDLHVQHYIELSAGHEAQYATYAHNDAVVRLGIKSTRS